jgi:hypothetical protein
MSDHGGKARENRLRRAARRQGITLRKSPRRDPRAYDFGGYMLIDPQTNTVVAGEGSFAFSMSIDDVEAWLADPPTK